MSNGGLEKTDNFSFATSLCLGGKREGLDTEFWFFFFRKICDAHFQNMITNLIHRTETQGFVTRKRQSRYTVLTALLEAFSLANLALASASAVDDHFSLVGLKTRSKPIQGVLMGLSPV